MAQTTVTHKTVNGIDVQALGDTVRAIRQDPGLGRFQFRAENRWIGDSRNRSRIGDFYGAGQEQRRERPYEFEADEPPALLGKDRAANPVEYALHALAACVTTTMVMHAAARGIRLEEVESTLEGDIDVRGFLGLSDDVPKGYQQIRVNFRVKSDAPEEQLRELARMSPVFNTITQATPVAITIEKR